MKIIMISMWTLISVYQGTKCPHQFTSPSPYIQQRSVSIAHLWTFPKNLNTPNTQSFDLLLLLIMFMVALGPCERRMRTLTALLSGLRCDFDRISHFIVVNIKWTRFEGLKPSFPLLSFRQLVGQTPKFIGGLLFKLCSCLLCKSTVDMMVMSSARATS